MHKYNSGLSMLRGVATVFSARVQGKNFAPPSLPSPTVRQERMRTRL